MPTDYELWATQHGVPQAQLVQVLEFEHPAFDHLWITDYGAKFAAVSDAAVSFEAEAVSFTIELPTQNPSTQSEMSISLDALGGFIVNNIRNMTDAQRAVPIIVRWYVYLDIDRAAPVTDSLQFEVVSIQATRLAASISCAATILPNVQAGTRYTLEHFPTLAFL